jgi:hypothetical protein
MCSFCPGPVGSHNLVCPKLYGTIVPVWDHFCFAMTVAGHEGGRCPEWASGATHDLAQKGSLSEWPGECHAIDWFCRNVVGPPEWDYEAMNSVMWVQCTNLCRVYNLSIVASSVMDTVHSRSHRGSTELNNLHTEIHKMAHAEVGDRVRITMIDMDVIV